jgi:hypothetical protein
MLRVEGGRKAPHQSLDVFPWQRTLLYHQVITQGLGRPSLTEQSKAGIFLQRVTLRASQESCRSRYRRKHHSEVVVKRWRGGSSETEAVALQARMPADSYARP